MSARPRPEADISEHNWPYCFGIRSIPTLIAFKNGREVARQSGALGLPQLLQWINADVPRN